MMRLVRRGLMFGNLFEVTSPSLIERYNRALKHLTGQQTALTEFHIDISGYSPEIGDALEDPLYLNPNGCNRQFILLSTDQKTAPLLDAQFSTSRSILRRWIADNESQLFALTTRDAVAGELVNSVFSVADPSDLLAIREIEVEADTTRSTVQDSRELRVLIDRFMTQDDAWWDDVLTADMIEIAKRTGDITRNPVIFTNNRYEQGNYYTTHFGGLYVFRDTDASAVISVHDPLTSADWDADQVLDFSQRNDIATFLESQGLVEPITSAKNLDAAAILRQKLDFIVVDTAAEAGEDFGDLSRRDLRNLARRHLKDLPKEYEGLHQLWRWASGQGKWPHINSEHPAYFYTLRSADHGDTDLVNMLLAQLAPLDVRQLFICHKQAFYAAYRGWSDTKKEYVADFLAREYMVDKAGAREALFGHEPAMAEQVQSHVRGPWDRPETDDDLVVRVGPWGAVRRN